MRQHEAGKTNHCCSHPIVAVQFHCNTEIPGNELFLEQQEGTRLSHKREFGMCLRTLFKPLLSCWNYFYRAITISNRWLCM
jgi:hypothetical protein